jgi:hypothetical protein
MSINNLSTTFPLTFNYYLFKNEETFNFFFNSLKEIIFLKGTKFIKGVNTSLPKVMIND